LRLAVCGFRFRHLHLEASGIERVAIGHVTANRGGLQGAEREVGGLRKECDIDRGCVVGIGGGCEVWMVEMGCMRRLQRRGLDLEEVKKAAEGCSESGYGLVDAGLKGGVKGAGGG